jgi:hypothetical protein
MEESSVPRRGPVEGTNRILRELLRTPRFKKTVNVLLSQLDPENVALVVRTLIWEDPEFFLSLLGSAPSLINMGVNGLAETCRQLGNFPTGLLASFLAQTTEELDAEKLGETIGLTVLLTLSIGEADNPLLGPAGTDFATRFGRGLASSMAEGAGEDESASDLLLGKLLPALGTMAQKLGEQAAREGSEINTLVSGLAEGIRTLASENPDFMRSFVVPLVEAGRLVLAEAEAAGEGP